MNITLECEVVLSKKMEAVCENGEPLTIHITSISGNKGRAIVHMTCKNGIAINEVSKIGETSLMLKVCSASDDVQVLSHTRRVSNFIANVAPASIEDTIAKVSPNIPEAEPYAEPTKEVNPKEAAHALDLLCAALKAAGLYMPESVLTSALKTKQPDGAGPLNQTISSVPASKPAAFSDNCIMTYDELIKELTMVPDINKTIQIPTGRKLTPQEAENFMTQMPRLRKKAYLRNKLPSQFMIADLFTTFDGSGGSCLALLPGAAFDLTRIPAKNILNSSELKWCFETNKVELVNSAMYIASFKKIESEMAERETRGGLPVYGGETARVDPHGSAGGSAERIASSVYNDAQPMMPINDAEPDAAMPSLYEEDPMMRQIMGTMPSER